MANTMTTNLPTASSGLLLPYAISSTLGQPITTLPAPAGAPKPEAGPNTESEDHEQAAATEEAEVWNEYKCKTFPHLKKHPGSIVEPASLAAVNLPPLTFDYRESLGTQVDEGKLSGLQMEGIAYACQQHRRFLPSGARMGMLVADSAGMGKGRQAAGIIVDSLFRNRPRHLWLSVSSELRLDAERDFKDLGVFVPVLDGCGSLDAAKSHGLGSSTTHKSAVLFSTYQGLVSEGSNRGKRNRFEQIVDWCGGEGFEGCIVFDECHKAKNNKIAASAKSKANSMNKTISSSSEDQGSKTAKVVLALQRRMPRARVVYASATGFSEVGHMAFLERLGLWGVGSPFLSFQDFCKQMESRSMGAMEMLAVELKSAGLCVSRSIGFQGAEFGLVEAELDGSALRLYHECTSLWVDLHESAKAYGRGGGRAMSTFWAAHQRFFKQLCMALKVPTVVAEARQAIAAGRCFVIGLQSTGESALQSELASRAAHEELTEFVSVCKATVSRVISQLLGPEPEEEKLKREKAEADKLVASGGKQGEEQRETLRLMYQKIKKQQLTHQHETDLHTLRYSPSLLTPEVQAFVFPHQSTPSPNVVNESHIKTLLSYQKLQLMRLEEYHRVEDAAILANSSSARDTESDSAKALEIMEELLERVEEMSLPASALDTLIDELGGPGAVAELTGRTTRVVRNNHTNALVLDVRTTSGNEESVNVKEKNLFLAGKKLVAIISDAASTGISLHADPRYANTRRRVHCTIELPFSCTQAIQQLGRTHRTSQLSAPVYRLVSSGLPGEKRFMSTVASRLASLGALTQGDRRATAASGLALGEFDYETRYARQALNLVWDSVLSGEFMSDRMDWRQLAETVHEATKESPRVSSNGTSFNTQSGTKGGSVDSNNKKRTLSVRNASQHPLWQRVGVLDSEESVMLHLQVAMYFIGDLDLPDASAVGKVRDFSTNGQKVIKDADKRNTRRFLNRMLGLPSALQHIAFNYFTAIHKSVVRQAIQSGKFDSGASDVKGVVKRVGEVELIYEYEQEKLKMHHFSVDRGVSFESAVAMLVQAKELDAAQDAARGVVVEQENNDLDVVDQDEEDTMQDDEGGEEEGDGWELLTKRIKKRRKARQNDDDDDEYDDEYDDVIVEEEDEQDNDDGDDDDGAMSGFYISKRHMLGQHMVLLAIRSEGSFICTRPNSGTSNMAKKIKELLKWYRPCKDEAEANAMWTDAWTHTATACSHPPKYHDKHTPEMKASCVVGKRLSSMDLLTGTLTPAYNLIDTAKSSIEKGVGDRSHQNIVRCELEDGERVVGVIWPSHAPSSILKTHAATWLIARAQGAQMVTTVRIMVPGGSSLGIGDVRLTTNGMHIGTVQEGSPADMFGLAHGFVVKSWNGLPVKDLESEAVYGLIARCEQVPEGEVSYVRLTVEAPRSKQKNTGGAGSGKGQAAIEAMSPVDPVVVKRLTTEPKTMKHFFQRKPTEEIETETQNPFPKQITSSPSSSSSRGTRSSAQRAKTFSGSVGAGRRNAKRTKSVGGGGTASVMRSFFGMPQKPRVGAAVAVKVTAKGSSSSSSTQGGGGGGEGSMKISDDNDDVEMIDLVGEDSNM